MSGHQVSLGQVVLLQVKVAHTSPETLSVKDVARTTIASPVPSLYSTGVHGDDFAGQVNDCLMVFPLEVAGSEVVAAIQT